MAMAIWGVASLSLGSLAWVGAVVAAVAIIITAVIADLRGWRTALKG
jgi:hypothetical protein